MPWLRIKSGRDAGRDIELSTDTVAIGRHPDNDLVLDDASASRFHARLVRKGDRYAVHDVGSSLGTRVNDARLTEDHELVQGDRIRIGHAEIVYVDNTPADESAEQLARTITRTSWFDPDEQHEALDEQSIVFSLSSVEAASAERLSARRSELLAEVAEAIQSQTDLNTLLSKLLEVVFEVFQPDRGVILLFDPPEEGDLVPKVSRPAGVDFTISRTIVNHAIEKKLSLLVADAAADERFSEAQSIRAHSIQAAVCAPLVCRNRVLGALYLDTQIDVIAHEPEELVLLNLIAANAAIAIENAVLIQEKLAATRLGADEPGPIIADSSRMQLVQQCLQELAQSRSPVLIAGRPGTGKLFAAKTVHVAAGDREAPFCMIDCADLSAGKAESVLFGNVEGDEQTKTDSREMALTRGALSQAAHGTLVLRHVTALDPGSQQRLSEYLETVEASDANSHDVRIVATTSEDVRALAESGRFHAPLAQQLCANALEMPTLRERKEDIIPLARYFLSRAKRRAHEYRPELNISAEQSLKRSQFRHRNVAELRDAMELASAVADGPHIGAEHIFTGPQGTGLRPEFDLLRVPLVRWLASRAPMTAVQASVLVFFVAIAVLCLASPETVVGQVANALVWGLWWPVLMLLFLFLGRVWCTVCPIARVGRLAQRMLCFDRRPPQWLKQRTDWILPALFVVIIWSEHVFDMPLGPMGTGFLLLALMACAVAFSVTYARDVWCRYACPLGGLAASYSVLAPLYVHANPSRCAIECKTECFKGGDSNAGCPMYHHPLYVRDAHFCKLCLECLRHCPNESPRLYLRPPMQDVWRLEELGLTLTPLALVLLFLTLVMLAQSWFADAWTFTGAVGLAVVAAAATSAVLPRLLSPERDPAVAARVAFGLLLLAWGPLTAFHLSNVPGLDALRIAAPAGSVWARFVPVSEISLLQVLQFGAIGFATLLCFIALSRIRAHSAKYGTAVRRSGWSALLAACTAYLAASATLLHCTSAIP